MIAKSMGSSNSILKGSTTTLKSRSLNLVDFLSRGAQYRGSPVSFRRARALRCRRRGVYCAFKSGQADNKESMSGYARSPTW